MRNKEFGDILEQRTLDFTLQIITLSKKLPFTSEGKVIKNQITKSGSSIGANYHEANRSRSKADFKNKIKICESEANETIYWLKVIMGVGWLQNENINHCLHEASELLAIFTSIGNKLEG